MLLFYILDFWPQACGILALRNRNQICTLALECKVLTLGPQGKSLRRHNFNDSEDQTIQTQPLSQRRHYTYLFLRQRVKKPHALLHGDGPRMPFQHWPHLHGLDDVWATHSFLAERLKHPPRVPWPATRTGNGPCASLSGTSASRPLRSQHPSTGLWSDHLQNSGDTGTQTRSAPVRDFLATSLLSTCIIIIFLILKFLLKYKFFTMLC